jgi:peptidoglycan/xylan/chitin deacetylase (PgdA/CDA1 family)
MTNSTYTVDRREFLAATAATVTGLCWSARAAAAPRPVPKADGVAQIAITLDLEMARNFPNWEDKHWDYEKGNLNEAAKQYTLAACRRVKARGGKIHTFVVGQVFEQENVDWLKEIAVEGHAIGNHTYDHVYLLAKSPQELQFRFQRSPWLISGRDVQDIIRENIKLTNMALKERVGVAANGFRTPGGFATGLQGREGLQKMLQDLGFEWVSSLYPAHEIVDLHGAGQAPAESTVSSIMAAQPAAQPHKYPTGLVEIPMSPISDIGAFRNGRWRLEDFLKVTQAEVEWAIENHAAFDFLSHPSCLGVVDPQFRTIDMICDLVEKSDGAAMIVTLDQMAQQLNADQPAAQP